MEPLTTRSNKQIAIYPATPLLLNKLHITSNGYTSYRDKLLKDKITEYNYSLRPYQNMALNFLLNNSIPCKAIFDEQRLGKTPTILSYLKITNKTAMIVVPKSLLYQWETEFKKWYNNNVIVIDAPSASQRNDLFKKAIETKSSIIVSYTTFRINEEELRKIAKYVDTMVLDEAHRIRNIRKNVKQRPKEAVALISISKLVKEKIALTGTPAPNYSYDIYAILAFLYPNIYTSFYNFSNYYYIVEEKWVDQDTTAREVTTFFKPGKQQELLEFLETISIQRKRKDVMKWLPKYDIQKIELNPTELQKEANFELRTKFKYKHLECITILDMMITQRELAVSPLIIDLEEEGPKINFIKDYINDYPDKQLIIVSTFVKPLKYLKSILKKAALLYGDTKPADREKIKIKFQNKEIKIILANISVIKEGFTLDAADTTIFLDSSFIYTDNIQCMDRLVPVSIDNVHKEGQDIILLVLKDSIDEYVYHMVYEEKADSTEIINNYIKQFNRKE